MIDWGTYHKSLLLQEAILKLGIEENAHSESTPEREGLILMLGCVETQKTFVSKAMLRENRNDFDNDN